VPTNLAIDDDLLDQALRLSGLKTKRETVNEALREFVQRRLRLRTLDMIGKIDFDPAWDYKRDRRRL
jgi:Arc/MetJ family transcription regulator